MIKRESEDNSMLLWDELSDAGRNALLFLSEHGPTPVRDVSIQDGIDELLRLQMAVDIAIGERCYHTLSNGGSLVCSVGYIMTKVSEGQRE